MKAILIITLILSISHIKSNEEDLEALSGNSNAEEMMDQNDSSAIDNAVMRLESLVRRAQRLKSKLMRELSTTVSYLKFHFNQRSLFDSKVMNQKDFHDGLGEEIIKDGGERKLYQSPLMNYGGIENNNYQNMKLMNKENKQSV